MDIHLLPPPSAPTVVIVNECLDRWMAVHYYSLQQLTMPIEMSTQKLHFFYKSKLGPCNETKCMSFSRFNRFGEDTMGAGKVFPIVFILTGKLITVTSQSKCLFFSA